MDILLSRIASTVMNCQAGLKIFPFDFPLAIKFTNCFLVLWVTSFEYVLIKDQHAQ